MKTIVVAGLLSALSLPTPAMAQAQDVRNAHEELFGSLFAHMATTYVCREALGGLGQYQAARTIAVNNSAPFVGEKKAVQDIADFEKRLKSDPRSNQTSVGRDWCAERVSEELFRIRQARAALMPDDEVR